MLSKKVATVCGRDRTGRQQHLGCAEKMSLKTEVGEESYQCTPIIPALWGAEIGEPQAGGQPGLHYAVNSGSAWATWQYSGVRGERETETETERQTDRQRDWAVL